MSQKRGYPRFLRRFQAVTIDSILLGILFIGLLLILSKWGITGRNSILITLIVVLLWEPLWISLTGGSVGHHLIGLRVISKRTGRNLTIFASFVRFLFKTCLGIPAMVFIFITRYHQALHDGIVRSVVILNDPETKPDYEYLAERQVELAGYRYPSVLRRSIMIIVYNVLLIYLIGTITGYLLPAQCLVNGHCSTQQEALLTAWQVVWVIGIVLIIIFCWKGMITGCRKKQTAERK